jgi:plasmid maintenance system antidote protein VapI
LAFLEYQLNSYRNHMYLRENDAEQRWLMKSGKKTDPYAHLEEEIHTLRRLLEQMVNEGRSMTSDTVIELSTILDSKINEYMIKTQKAGE